MGCPLVQNNSIPVCEKTVWRRLTDTERWRWHYTVFDSLLYWSAMYCTLRNTSQFSWYLFFLMLVLTETTAIFNEPCNMRFLLRKSPQLLSSQRGVCRLAPIIDIRSALQMRVVVMVLHRCGFSCYLDKASAPGRDEVGGERTVKVERGERVWWHLVVTKNSHFGHTVWICYRKGEMRFYVQDEME